MMSERLHNNQAMFQVGGCDGELKNISNVAARHPTSWSATQQENQASSALESADTPVYMSMRECRVSCLGPVFMCTGTFLSPLRLHNDNNEDVTTTFSFLSRCYSSVACSGFSNGMKTIETDVVFTGGTRCCVCRVVRKERLKIKASIRPLLVVPTSSTSIHPTWRHIHS